MFYYFDIISIIIGISGFVYAIYQGVRARKIKTITKNYCRIRCEDLQAILSPLINDTQKLCLDVGDLQYRSDKKNDGLEIALSKIQVISALLGQLIRFFKRLNQEFEFEYDDKIFKNVNKALPSIYCDIFAQYTGIINGIENLEDDNCGRIYKKKKKIKDI